MVDRYTKVVLTVIAVALSVIAVRGTAGPAKAQGFGQQHVIVDALGPYIVSLPLPVHVEQ